jgi:hypothetical protein
MTRARNSTTAGPNLYSLSTTATGLLQQQAQQAQLRRRTSREMQQLLGCGDTASARALLVAELAVGRGQSMVKTVLRRGCSTPAELSEIQAALGPPGLAAVHGIALQLHQSWLSLATQPGRTQPGERLEHVLQVNPCWHGNLPLTCHRHPGVTACSRKGFACCRPRRPCEAAAAVTAVVVVARWAAVEMRAAIKMGALWAAVEMQGAAGRSKHRRLLGGRWRRLGGGAVTAGGSTSGREPT